MQYGRHRSDYTNLSACRVSWRVVEWVRAAQRVPHAPIVHVGGGFWLVQNREVDLAWVGELFPVSVTEAGLRVCNRGIQFVAQHTFSLSALERIRSHQASAPPKDFLAGMGRKRARNVAQKWAGTPSIPPRPSQDYQYQLFEGHDSDMDLRIRELRDWRQLTNAAAGCCEFANRTAELCRSTKVTQVCSGKWTHYLERKEIFLLSSSRLRDVGARRRPVVVACKGPLRSACCSCSAGARSAVSG